MKSLKFKPVWFMLLCWFAVTPALAQPLVKAIRKGKLKKARKLIKKDKGINEGNAEETPLTLALLKARKAPEAYREMIHAMGQDVEVIIPYSRTTEAYIEIAHLLVEAGADINAATFSGETPLSRALLVDAAFAGMLMEKGADVAAANNRATLLAAAGRCPAEMLEKLAEGGADIRAHSYTDYSPLHEAAKFGNASAVRYLVRHDFDPNTRDRSWDTNIIDEEGLPDDHPDQLNTPLHYAAMLGQLETGEYLEGDYAATIKVLLENGADPNVRNGRGDTPLHFLAWQNDTASMHRLILYDADVSAMTKDSLTVLHGAAINNHREAVYLLLEHHATILPLDKTPEDCYATGFIYQCDAERKLDTQSLEKAASLYQRSAMLYKKEIKKINKQLARGEVGNFLANVIVGVVVTATAVVVTGDYNPYYNYYDYDYYDYNNTYDLRDFKRHLKDKRKASLEAHSHCEQILNCCRQDNPAGSLEDCMQQANL